jgi:O-antigen/teichoic acid export membrane protein
VIRIDATSKLLIHHAGRSVAARILVLPITAVLNFIAIAILVRHTGADVYGLMSLIIAIPLLLLFADLGVGAEVTNAVAASSHPSGDPHVSSVLRSAMRAVLVSGAIIATCAITLLFSHMWDRVIGTTGLQSGMDIGVTIAVVLFAVGITMGLGQRILIGAQANHFVVLCGTLPSIFLFLGVVSVTYSNGPMWLFPVIAGVANLSAPLGMALASRAKTGISLLQVLKEALAFRRYPGVRLRHSAVPMIVVSLGGPLIFQSGRWVVAHVLSLAAVANYSIVAQLYLSCLSVVSAGATVLWPLFANHRETEQPARGLWKRAVVLMALAGGTLGLLIVLVGPYVVRVMTNGTLSPSFGLYIAFASLLAVQAFHSASGMLMTDASGLRYQAVCSVMTLGVSIPASILSAQSLGPIGPVISTGLCFLVLYAGPTWFAARRRLRSEEIIYQERV